VPFYGVKIQKLSLPDIVAHKLCVALERGERARRDWFDVHYFLGSPMGAVINEQIIFDRTKLTMKEFYKTLEEKVRKTNRARILDGLGEVLEESQKDWARAKLIDELMGLIERNRDLC